MSLTVHDRELDFYRFVYERHSIYCKRLAGEPWPWTVDQVLQKHRFCCVFRELDRATKYLIQSIIDDGTLSIQDKMFNIVMFRIFNICGFYHNVLHVPVRMENFQPDVIIELMDKAIAKGVKLFAGVYMIPGSKSRKDIRPKEKHVQVVYGMAESINRGVFAGDLPDTAKETYERLLHAVFLGRFLAYQCLCDISYIPGVKFKDMDEFVITGPGAVPTVKRIYGDDVDAEAGCIRLYQAQDYVWDELKKRDGLDFGALLRGQTDIATCRTVCVDGPRYVRLSDCQNCACENRKYYNYSHGLRQRRRIFRYSTVGKDV